MTRILALIAAVVALAVTHVAAAESAVSSWSGWGGNIYNNRWQNTSNIASSNVGTLKQVCALEYFRGVSATPVVQDGVVYFPTWSGMMIALDQLTCGIVWQYNVSQLIHDFGQTEVQLQVNYQSSRTSPAIDGDILYFGTQASALLVALNRTTGEEIAHIQTNEHPYAALTTSPTIYNGVLYVGVASHEEVVILKVPDYQCCSFVGNMVAYQLIASKFSQLWNVNMVPNNTDWTGAAIWGSQPSIDEVRSQVFIATGNVYSVPEAYETCQNQTQNMTTLSGDPCLPKNVYQEAVLAFDLKTGFINWVNQLSPLDAWNAACETANGTDPEPNVCPYTPGLDTDFGMAPSFIPGGPGTPQGIDIVVVGQKNGNLYALSAQAGRLLWATATSPDGGVGGLIWGVAADDQAVYFTAVNSNLDDWTLQPSGQKINGSAFGAVSLKNGTILWETAPQAYSAVPPTVVNDVVFFGRQGSKGLPIKEYDSSNGAIIPVNKYTGEILADFPLNAPLHGGFAIVQDLVMFGTGYAPPYNGTGQFSVWALS